MLEVRILGTAAGGGFPQWNCACENCRLARSGKLPGRLQSGVAVSGNGTDWHLVNASPDVSRQVGEFLMQPDDGLPAQRFDPVASVFVTNADLDHTLGLFQLREGSCLPVTTPSAVRESLVSGLRIDDVLESYAGIEWRDAPFDWTIVDKTGLEARAVPLRGSGPPRYDANPKTNGPHAVGYLFRSGGRIAGVFPDVAVLDGELLAALAECDRIWFDGTFWSDGEMLDMNGRTAAQMGHVPVSESLTPLSRLGAGRVSYLHINNTNPILRPDSPERAGVLGAGLTVAEDGDRWV